MAGYVKLARVVKIENPDIVFLVYVRLISIVKLFLPRPLFIFDVRTGSLFDNNLKRKFWNFLIWFESLSFKHITIISEGLQNKLYLPAKKCHWLPLGGDKKKFIKNFSNINLLYLGTFDQRNIHLTIEGLEIFKNNHPDIPVHYNIVGYGKADTEEKIKATILKCKLERDVTYFGRIPYDQIDHYLEESNIGVVYVPVTTYYNYQPSTKLFEFILAGMPVLATKTEENKKIVNSDNGILIDESPKGFSTGLEQISERITYFNEELIRNSISGYCWEDITKTKLKPLLYNLLKDGNTI
jgi:glycosyltransferase involved in cell wall biosynthesis